MRRRIVPVASAFFVGVGLVLAEFSAEARPIEFLVRPSLAVAVMAIVIGLMASLSGQASALVAVFALIWLIRPDSPVAIVVTIGLGLVIGWRLWKGEILDVQTPVTAAAAVFMLAGLVPIVPQFSWSTPAAATEPEGPPTYLVLLDGYPRGDTLAELGVDVSPFIDQLERRGFDHYPDATSHHSWTFRTLTVMTTGQTMSNDDWGTPQDRRSARDSWSLPAGFVAIAPPVGSTTIPNVPTLNPGGPTVFESELLGQSMLAPFARDYVMDGLRYQLDRALDVLASTDEPRVFAHLLAPHTPFLYNAAGEPEGAPSCWPDCIILEIQVETLGISVAEWAAGISEYLEWLNPKLLDVIDAITARYPDAEIVLFSDHGGRFSTEKTDEWHRVFLASRTPNRPYVLAESPHPGSVFDVLELTRR